MQSLIPLVALAALLAIVVSLGSGLFHLARGGKDDSRKLARDLTIRISISIALFLLLLLAWALGWISPHGLQAGGVPR